LRLTVWFQWPPLQRSPPAHSQWISRGLVGAVPGSRGASTLSTSVPPVEEAGDQCHWPANATTTLSISTSPVEVSPAARITADDAPLQSSPPARRQWRRMCVLETSASAFNALHQHITSGVAAP